MAEHKTESVSKTAEGLISDLQKSLSDRFGHLRDDLMEEIGHAGAAGASVGGGLGMAALGTILGGLAFVHLMHRMTGLPLWACYAGSSALACSAGAGLLAGGVKQASDMGLIPEGTGQVANRIAEHVASGK